MKRTLWIALVPALALFAGPAPAQSLLTSRNVEVQFQNYLLRGAVLRDSWLARHPQPTEQILQGHLLDGAVDAPAGVALATYVERLYGLERHELSRFDLALQGAGTGATLGLFAGAVGNTLGAWDEQKTWYLVGAMSALGAILGGSKADDPAWRIQYRWETDDGRSR